MKKQTPMQELKERLLIDRDNFPEMHYHINSIIEDIDSELLEKEKQSLIEFHVECVREGTERERQESDPEFSKNDELIVRKDATQYFNETFQR